MNIHQIGNGKSFLTEEQLRPLTSIYATTPLPEVSTQYKQIRTLDLINLFAGQGWLPVSAQEMRTVKSEREGFQKHMVRFRQEGKFFNGVGDLALEIILTNAHDTTSAYNLMLGLFRLACLNGMVVSEGTFGTIRIVHKGFDPKDVIDASFKVVEEGPKLLTSVNTYKQIELTQPERIAFAESAIVQKLDPGEDEAVVKDGNILRVGSRAFDATRLLRPYREADQKSDLWTTFNVVQEKLTKGGRFEVNSDKTWKQKKARGISAINENLRVNKGLWHLMSEMAKIKGATA